jgi:hypothetical protein
MIYGLRLGVGSVGSGGPNTGCLSVQLGPLVPPVLGERPFQAESGSRKSSAGRVGPLRSTGAHTTPQHAVRAPDAERGAADAGPTVNSTAAVASEVKTKDLIAWSFASEPGVEEDAFSMLRRLILPTNN